MNKVAVEWWEGQSSETGDVWFRLGGRTRETAMDAVRMAKRSKGVNEKFLGQGPKMRYRIRHFVGTAEDEEV